MKMASRIAFFLGLAAVYVVAYAQLPARVAKADSLVRKVLEASRKMTYSGTRTVELKVGPDRIRHVEFVLKDGPRTRIEFPKNSDYAGQVIVETPRVRKQFLPDRDEVRVSTPRGDLAQERLGLILRNRSMKVNVSEGPMIANLPTRLLTVRDPQDNLQQKMWIHPSSGLILKREIYDRSGAMVGFFEFSSVNLNPQIKPGDFELNAKGIKATTPQDRLKRIVSVKGYQLITITLPRYRLISAREVNLGQKGEKALVQTFTSPSGSVTLFQSKARVSADRLRQTAKGRLSSRIWTKDGISYGLVGSVSEIELDHLKAMLTGQ